MLPAKVRHTQVEVHEVQRVPSAHCHFHLPRCLLPLELATHVEAEVLELLPQPLVERARFDGCDHDREGQVPSCQSLD